MNEYKPYKPQEMVKSIYLSLVALHTGGLVTKFQASFFLSLLLTPFAFLFEGFAEWLNINGGYVTFVFLAIALDHLLGTYVHAFIKRDFHWRENLKGLAIKISMVIVVALIAEGFSAIGQENVITTYFTWISRLIVFIYPAGSALMNVSVITDGKFPPVAWMKKISQFNQNLDVNEFKTPDKK